MADLSAMECRGGRFCASSEVAMLMFTLLFEEPRGLRMRGDRLHAHQPGLATLPPIFQSLSTTSKFPDIFDRTPVTSAAPAYDSTLTRRPFCGHER